MTEKRPPRPAPINENLKPSAPRTNNYVPTAGGNVDANHKPSTGSDNRPPPPPKKTD